MRSDHEGLQTDVGGADGGTMQETASTNQHDPVAVGTTRIRPRVARLVAMLTVALAAVLLPTATPAAAASNDDTRMWELINQARGANGRGGLQYDAAASAVAATWTDHQAATNTLAHNPNLRANIETYVTTQWQRLGENVGYVSNTGSINDVQTLHNAFMNSSGHRANVLGDYNRVGISHKRSGGRVWVTVVFLKGPNLDNPTPDPISNPPADWFTVKTANLSGSNLTPLEGDFDGDGKGDVFWYQAGSTQDSFWWGTSGGQPQVTVQNVRGTYKPFVGDFDGNGKDDIFWYAAGTAMDYFWYFTGRGHLHQRQPPGERDLQALRR